MPSRRVLSIAPGVSRIGFCYFEGTELLDWGVRPALSRARGRRSPRGLEAVTRLLDQYRPQLVILPLILKSDGRRPGQRKLIDAIRVRLVGGPADVAVCGGEAVTNCFRELTKHEKPTKHQIMTQLGVLFPELSPLLPRPRRPWHPQDYWTPMFAAAAQAVAWTTNSS